MGQWVFSELRGDDVRRGPNETELFKTEQTAEGEYAGTDALVREVLQNAIDAGTGDGAVRVRLAVHEPHEAPSGTRLAYYFARLRPALKGRQIEFDDHGAPKLPCRFLVVEDFGTHGLEGDAELFRDPPPGSKGPQYFYWFWRNIGRSGKTGEELGRWGLGKTVYRGASRVGCMFGLTARRSDGRKLMMGQSVLQIHEIHQKEYKPEGYWCSKQGKDGLPLAIEESQELATFCKEWRLSRNGEAGLSVVAPFVREELRADRLLQAVAVHFFTRILRGELEVEVAGQGVGSVTLNRDTIGAACEKMAWDGPARTKRHIAPPIGFASECLATAPAIESGTLGTERIPKYDDGIIDESRLHDVRRRFAAGELLGVRLHLNLPRRSGPAHVGRFDAYLRRRPGERCESYYVREGMTITKISSPAAKRGVEALVLVDRGPLAELLGDTEGPAHEDWDTSQERPDRNWKTWKGRVAFVRRAVDGLVELLTPPTTEPDYDLLSDFFSIEKVGGSGRERATGAEAKGAGRLPDVIAQPKWFQITSRSGGFTVSRNDGVKMPDAAALRVAVAYDLPQGDPLRNWSNLDFEISENGGRFKPKMRGLKMETIQGNVVLLTEIEQNFSFSVGGFDQHRDLYVRVDEERPASEETDDDQAG